jgi:hypothetical protein
MKVVYVAGRFRGKTAWHVAENVRAAEQVGYHVAAAGAMPLIPHANTAHFDGTMTAEFWLEGTMELLRRCDAVMMVPGWLDSKGALAERAEAQRIGLPVFSAGDYDALKGWLAGVTAGEAKPTCSAASDDGTMCEREPHGDGSETWHMNTSGRRWRGAGTATSPVPPPLLPPAEPGTGKPGGGE